MEGPTSKFGFKAGYPDPEGVQSVRVLIGKDTSNNAFVDKAYVDARAGGSVTIPVNTSGFEDGAVTTAKLASSAVSTGKLVDSSITTAKLAEPSISASNLASTTITSLNIAPGAVTTSKFVAGTLVGNQIATGAVTSAKIADGAVDTTQLANASVTSAKFEAGAVTNAKLGTGVVSTDKVANLAVTVDKIANSNVTTAKIASGATITNAFFATTSEMLGNAVLRFEDSVVAGACQWNVTTSSGTDSLNIAYNGSIGAAAKTLQLNSNSTTGTGGTNFRYRDAAASIFSVYRTDDFSRPVVETGKVSTDVEDTFVCDRSGTTRAVVEDNGDCYCTNGAYVAFSDERLKENIQPCNSQWADVSKIRFVKYKLWRDLEKVRKMIKASEEIPDDDEPQEGEEYLESEVMLGVIAQELEAAGLGGLVTETENLKEVKLSILQLKCMIALQELMRRIEDLEAKTNN